MNDPITLTIEPALGGAAVPWTDVKLLIGALEDTYDGLSVAAALPGFKISDAKLIVVGAPSVGSQRWRFELKVRAEFSDERAADARSGAARQRKWIEDVGVEAVGGVIAAALMLAFVGPSMDGQRGAENDYIEFCAARMRMIDKPVNHLCQAATQSEAKSVRLGFRDYPELELVRPLEPLNLRSRDRRPASPLRITLVDVPPIPLLMHGKRRWGYFVKRRDSELLALALFQERLPKRLDREDLFVSTRLINTEKSEALQYQPDAWAGAGEETLADLLARVGSVLVVNRYLEGHSNAPDS